MPLLTQNPLRAQRDGTEDVRAGTNPRVEENRELPARLSCFDLRGCHDVFKCKEGGDRSVNLTATCDGQYKWVSDSGYTKLMEDNVLRNERRALKGRLSAQPYGAGRLNQTIYNGE